MLCITRKLQQQIVVTTPTKEYITITINELQPSKCSICIDAPITYAIDRSEVFIRNTESRNISNKTIHDYE